ncbi:MAG: response regulator [SAR324 cluster bacterium]|nr:response regulator [SAR324 cluster bacterium]
MAKYDKFTCLIADDYSTARRIIKNILNELGFSCLEAEDGEQALAIILSTQLNLVLADVKMPNKNGLELLEDIRDDDNLKELPVILTMIEPLEELISTGVDLGMNDYLIKPFDVFTLAKVLEKVIVTEGGESL